MVHPCEPFDAFEQVQAMEDGKLTAYKSKVPIVIDGCIADEVWSQSDWYDMNYIWMGDPVALEDYQGRFKVAWDEDFLYLIVAVNDDFLNPTLKDGLENYWKGDYVEVFIDEDGSGGDHKFNHQAFAYHVSTEGHAIDKNTQEETVFFDDHINVQRSQNGSMYVWEMAIKLYGKNFDENSNANIPVSIKAEKRIGFSVAYGDNDGRLTRENFMGSKKTHGANNDEGYINADVFGSLLFKE
ncbi:hypothetical protein NMS_2034 [Nonlabens marinus S1-08]|uniref:Carbohydrate-binding domain-containing protein n=2 Tax=Nonlabens TaxID=363408 RepID=W8VW59_9FLAO|nr:hypothetical protein NMS_2034 [Nonlabens marinus S1-08]